MIGSNNILHVAFLHSLTAAAGQPALSAAYQLRAFVTPANAAAAAGAVMLLC